MPTFLRSRALAAVVLLGALVVSMAGCRPSDYQFRVDDRMTILEPASQSTVTAPFRISWEMEDFDPAGLDGSRSEDSGAYAVFVDRPPMKAGSDLRSLFDDDPACASDARCPDAATLARENIYVTTKSKVRVRFLPLQGAGGPDLHTITIVLLDGSGSRIGESSWYRTFTTEGDS
ncbi:MAG: hypothetical protein F2667_06830 [Actinobacteria bacterium]|uniref:Unannotated protein n=1 Tax=freshwater metagenome TaxID=449393 RepID=A0A6J6Q8U4_9ZZZZ|nr:hypothetical protein [Actinomycetota bacterium]